MKKPPAYKMTRKLVWTLCTLFGGIALISTIIRFIKEVTKK